MPGMKSLLVALLTLVAPAFADTPVNPTVWHVKGPAGDAYLLGSIHILPPGVDWHYDKIAKAVAHSDVFVFEVPLDAVSTEKLQELVIANGYLGAKENLRDLLHPKYRADYDAAVMASGVDPIAVSHQRPWLAGLTMMFTQIAKLKFDPNNGPDTVLMRDAKAHGKDVRYLETMEDQFAVLAPSDPDTDRDEFEASLHELRDVAGEIQPMVNAWSIGDQKKLDELVNGQPAAQGTDRRPQCPLAAADQGHAEGKAHLLHHRGRRPPDGPKGIPALLRKAGSARSVKFEIIACRHIKPPAAECGRGLGLYDHARADGLLAVSLQPGFSHPFGRGPCAGQAGNGDPCHPSPVARERPARRSLAAGFVPCPARQCRLADAADTARHQGGEYLCLRNPHQTGHARLAGSRRECAPISTSLPSYFEQMRQEWRDAVDHTGINADAWGTCAPGLRPAYTIPLRSPTSR